MPGDDAETEIRAARPDEADEVLEVLCGAFGLNFDAARPIYYHDPFFDLSHKRILRTSAEGIVSCLTVIPSGLRVGSAWVPMGGIAGMATRPDHQGQGRGGCLLAATVPVLARELKYPLSALFPASTEFYRRFGWETASQGARWQGRPADLPASGASQFVRPLALDSPAEHAAIRALYAKVERTGACLRDGRRWRIIEAPLNPREWIVFQSPGEGITGYAVYQDDATNSPKSLTVLEMHAASAVARQGMLGYLRERLGWCDSMVWNAPEADLAALGLTRGSPAPGMMLRITDLCAALDAIHRANLAPVLEAHGQTLTVRASDAVCPDNECPTRLAATGVGQGTAADAAWIAADIRALSRIYLGDCTPSEACAEGTLEASSPGALELADQLFPSRAPFVSPLDQF